MEYFGAAMAIVVAFAIGQWWTHTLVVREGQAGIFYNDKRHGPSGIYRDLSIPLFSRRPWVVTLPLLLPYKGHEWQLKVQALMSLNGSIMRDYASCELVRGYAKKIRHRKWLEGDEEQRFQQWYKPLN